MRSKQGLRVWDTTPPGVVTLLVPYYVPYYDYVTRTVARSVTLARLLLSEDHCVSTGDGQGNTFTDRRPWASCRFLRVGQHLLLLPFQALDCEPINTEGGARRPLLPRCVFRNGAALTTTQTQSLLLCHCYLQFT